MKYTQWALVLCLIATGVHNVHAAPNIDAAMSYLGKARAFLISNAKLPTDVGTSRARMIEAKNLESAGLKLFGTPKFGESFSNCSSFSNLLQRVALDQNDMVRNAKADGFSVSSLSSNTFQAGTLYAECLYELDALSTKTVKNNK